MRCRTHALVAFILALAAPVAHAQVKPRIVVVPFDDLSGAPGARRVVVPAVERALAARGYEVVASLAVEALLDEERVRYVESLPPATTRRIAQRFGASLLMTASIVSFSSERAEVSIAARVLSPDGTLVWCGNAATTGDVTKGAFGLGATTDMKRLVVIASSRLLSDLPPPGALSPVRVRRRRVAAVPDHYADARFLAEKRRVLILPVENLTDDLIAPRRVEALLRNRLSERPGLEVVEPAEFRAALVATKVSLPSAIPPERLLELGRLLGTTLVVRGTVLSAAEVYLSVVDVESRRVLWSSLHARDGSDYERVLGFGAVRNPVELTDRMLVEMTEALYRSKR